MSNLDQCWKDCIAMWKWICKNLGRGKGVVTLKHNWLTKYRRGEDVYCSCFFCEWAKDHGQIKFTPMSGCSQCPGRMVDRRFKCGNIRYGYSDKPEDFLCKIIAMDKKRKASS